MLKRNKINKFTNGIMYVLPLLFVLSMLMLHLILPDKTFSKIEKRYLLPLPNISVESVLNATYGIKVEEYFSDQFPFRNFWLQVQKKTSKLLINQDQQ